jgi:hypothetical protein
MKKKKLLGWTPEVTFEVTCLNIPQQNEANTNILQKIYSSNRLCNCFAHNILNIVAIHFLFASNIGSFLNRTKFVLASEMNEVITKQWIQTPDCTLFNLSSIINQRNLFPTSGKIKGETFSSLFASGASLSLTAQAIMKLEDRHPNRIKIYWSVPTYDSNA